MVSTAIASAQAADAPASPALSAEALMNMPLEKLVDVEVTSASKYAQKESEAPSAVEVISADDIRTFGYKTLGEAINGLHGLYTSTDRQYNYVGLHLPLDYNSRFLIMVDGRRMNDDIYDQVDTGQLFMLDMALVDHIEYIPGPGSSIYGANALSGVINVISKKGADINGLQTAAWGGNFRTDDERATYGKLLDSGADVLLSASRYHSGGANDLVYPEYDSPATNNGDAHKIDGESAQHLFGKLQYEDFTFTSGFSDRTKQVPTALLGTIFDDPHFYSYDSNYYSELKYNTALSEKTQLEIEGFDQWYDYHAHLPYTGAPDEIINIDQANGNWWGGEIKVVSTAFDRQKIVAGLDYQYDLVQHVENHDVDPYTLYFDHNSHGSRTGLYLQDDYKLLQDLTLSAGARLDQHHMINGLQFNPRLGLIWDPRQDTTLKLIYGSAFRAPNVNEREVFSSPDNSEEHIKNYESDLEFRPGLGTKLTGALFYRDYSDVLRLNDTATSFDNTGLYRSYGFDLGAEKRWTNGRSVKLSFEHNIVYDETKAWTVDSPKNVAKFTYGEPLFNNKAKLGIENIFIDQRRTLQDGLASSYDLVNVNLASDKLLPGSDVALKADNVLNRHPQYVGGDATDEFLQNTIDGDGRVVELTLQHTF